MADSDTQILVKFVTKLPPELRVPLTEVAVPVTLKRYGLSQIINHLLALDPPRPFDFLIDGELLRKSLQQHLLDRSISTEAVLEVEYLPAVVPPEPSRALPHDDWVSAVAACSTSVLASGSYDGSIYLWNGQGECTVSFAAHVGGVTSLAAARVLPLLASGGKDSAVRLWRLPPHAHGNGVAHGRGKASGEPAAQLVAVCEGHSDTVDSVAMAPSGRRCCSGGWDGQLLLWRAGSEVLEAAEAAAPVPTAGATKKRKVTKGHAADGEAVPNGALQQAPDGSLGGHTQCVAAVEWVEEDCIVSGAWDHSVRRHDVEAGVNTDTHNGTRVVLAVGAAPGAGGRLVAFGGAEAAVRLWDVRAPATQEGLGVRAFGGHGGWVAALAWSPASAHHFASASHDGCVKMWDVRASVPLATLQAHTDKALAVGWWGGAGLVSGGADGKLHVYVSAGAGGVIE